jgi:hypothetical protein
MLVEERVMRDAWVMEMVGTPVDTNWRKPILLLLFPKEKGTQMEVFLESHAV